ncbi:1-phosphofructokinase family hexose kinase [Hyalangium rubrum]|uniref:1-phosphofructokinase family hexose kinase n=1 Tax=Hyalangium rubrum TaxID=3103134 RepID=A0ABU5GXQ0_9BACT|nr:1-phosphofructokinase family hexose kinase [Hyalangium sp. s54d21]MDY7225652.1 1-phosphofructokinase family hexose kinase [Hyalangium sp. s54d21]
MKPIVTLTINPTIDLATAVAEVTPEHKLRCDAERRDPGGGGLNVARVIRELGGESLALYPRGGSTGELLERLLEEKRLRRWPISISGHTRENFTVTERKSGREFRFVMPGPTLTEAEWKTVLDSLSTVAADVEFIVASGSLAPGVPVDFYARVAHIAREQNAKLVLDTSGEPLRAALEEGVFFAKPNRKEFRDMMGPQVDEPAGMAAAARSFLEKGRAEILVVSMGADGAMLTTREGQYRAVPPPVKTASSVGAGDSFVGGMTFGLARGLPPHEAFRWGIASGTAALMSQGTDLCSRQDVEHLLTQVQPTRLA